MKTQKQQPAASSRTLQSKSKASEQASVNNVLQAYKNNTAQLAGIEEEEPVQGKFETAQLAAEEEEPLQGKFETAQLAGIEEEEPVQGKFDTTQLAAAEEEEPLQGKFETAQLKTNTGKGESLPGKPDSAQLKANDTGLPDNLKSGVENLSGHSLEDVKVHYNSSKPAQVQAHAYAQGTDIHIAPGQEKHLPHEAWHVAQQKQGRVKPTVQKQGIAINDNAGLEKEADVMGSKALQLRAKQMAGVINSSFNHGNPMQLTSQKSSKQRQKERRRRRHRRFKRSLRGIDSQTKFTHKRSLTPYHYLSKAKNQGPHTIAHITTTVLIHALEESRLNVLRYLNTRLAPSPETAEKILTKAYPAQVAKFPAKVKNYLKRYTKLYNDVTEPDDYEALGKLMELNPTQTYSLFKIATSAELGGKGERRQHAVSDILGKGGFKTSDKSALSKHKYLAYKVEKRQQQFRNAGQKNGYLSEDSEAEEDL